MIILTDTFNGRTISRHRTVKAAVKADKAHNKAVKRANGQSSYIPTSITAEDGRDISEEIERERWLAYVAGECGPNGGKAKR